MSLQLIRHLPRPEAVGGVTVIHLNENSLCEPQVHALAEEWSLSVRSPGRHRLWLDFVDVRNISSMGLAKVVALHKQAKAIGGQVTLVNLDPFVYEVFEVTRLTTILDVQRGRVARRLHRVEPKRQSASAHPRRRSSALPTRHRARRTGELSSADSWRFSPDERVTFQVQSLIIGAEDARPTATPALLLVAIFRTQPGPQGASPHGALSPDTAGDGRASR